MKKITKLLLYYFFFLFKVLRVYTLYKNDVLYLIIFTGIEKHMNFTLFSFILIIVWFLLMQGRGQPQQSSKALLFSSVDSLGVRHDRSPKPVAAVFP